MSLSLWFSLPCGSQVSTGAQPKRKKETYSNILILAALEDLDHAFLLLMGTELVIQTGVTRAVEDTLGTVTRDHQHLPPAEPEGRYIPVSDEDLPAVHDVGQRDGAVVAPVVEGGEVVDEDDEVVGAALVEDLGGGDVCAGHFGVDW